MMLRRRQKRKRDEKAIFWYEPKLTSQLTATIILFSCLMILLPVMLYTYGTGIPRAQFIALCLLIVASRFVRRSYLTLSQNTLKIYNYGIEWTYMSRSGMATWSELSHFGKMQKNIFRLWDSDHRGIHTHTGQFIPIDHYIQYAPLPAIWSEQKRFLENSTGQYIYTHAPHLFDDLKQKKGKHDG